MAYIRLTDPAIEDLKAFLTLDRSVLEMILTKMLILELNPLAGEPLLGELMNWRKLTVGDRHWRIIWIPKKDKFGEQIIEISQVWAVGARSDEEIYEEMKRRIDSAPSSPRTTALAEVLKQFTGKVGNVVASPEPVDQPAPAWLLDRLEYTAGLSRDQIRGLSVDQAMELWDQYTSRPK